MTETMTLEQKLAAVVGADDLLTGEPMAAHTTFRVGGPADYYAVPADGEETAALIALCRREELPYYVIGCGSNLLVSDAGFRGLIIEIGRRMSSVSLDGTSLRAGAGVRLSVLAAEAASAGLGGLEFASGIPGTLGGAVFMNAGAYGGEMKDVIREAVILTEDGRIRTLSRGELDFGYRQSAVGRLNGIVLEAVLDLTPAPEEAIRCEMARLGSLRKEKQPLEYPSAGSTFKRPEGFYAGKLIMDAGLGGFAVGGAAVSEKHCGFIINRGGATAADIHTLIELVRGRVLEDSGVTLEPEVRLLGDFS